MPNGILTKQELEDINDAVKWFEDNTNQFKLIAEGLYEKLRDDKQLSPFIHFIKYRVKDSKHLREKIKRKAIEQKTSGKKPNINYKNLFTKVTDLVGVRILHLHTKQIEKINPIILSLLQEHKYPIIEGPTAICWDVEYENIFKKLEIPTNTRDSMYTSVHYIIRANKTNTITAELQVRTLMDEVWGEVSHQINYPNESTIESCKDQLKVLARFTSGCTRLVDSIFKEHNHKNKSAKSPRHQ